MFAQTAKTAIALKTTTARSTRASARSTRSVAVRAASDRELWYPGAVAPEYLNGSMAGDYGFDPLRLGANVETLPYLQEAELMNGRWAMAATAGILFTDATGLPKWWEAGAADYGYDFQTLVAFQVVVMGVLEAFRVRGLMKTGESGVLNMFPFDPAGLDAPDKRVKEVKNGRLAMVAFLGMVSSYAVTGLSPLEALEAHMANPQAVNLFTSAVGGESVAFIAFLSCAPTFLLAQKTLGDGKEEFRPIPW
ncbi:chlorophyll a/b-binding protein domain-containing protein [Ostreococcus tauri]|uniref:Chlorophyll a-b binding protein, chloroplastic n=2 Tax=Ostreococcus tauri TaxID=70448 RepID=A0A1Y5IA87_OSTTA|nr:chlorophyll a/b-binding protein domain-containing protein [Ostreococcus tauri]7YCA_6 Chain 6, Lhca6 [Ostreococcus tauri]